MFTVGYKVKVDSSSIFGVNPKYIEEEVAKKINEYSTNVEIVRISKHCEVEQVSWLNFHKNSIISKFIFWIFI